VIQKKKEKKKTKPKPKQANRKTWRKVLQIEPLWQLKLNQMIQVGD